MQRIQFEIPLLTLCTALSACALELEPEPEPEVSAQSAAVTQAPTTREAQWAVRIQGDTDCTAELLTRRWLLTAAHCLFGDPEVAGDRTVSAVDPVTGNTHQLYSGRARFILYPDYVHESDRVHDFALVQLLDGNGIDIPTYARLYADAREPWTAGFSAASRRFEVAGFGFGSNPGETSICEEAMSRQKRLGTEFELNGQALFADQAPAKVVGSFVGAQQLCDGDSGSPWLFRRGRTLMQFAVHSGSRGHLGGDKAATLVGPKLDWVLAHTFIRGRPIECFDDTRDGFRFQACQDKLQKLWFEAEDGTLTAPMAVGRSGNASRSRFVSVPSNTTASGGSVSIPVDITTTDNYILWLRTSASALSSLLISIDGGINILVPVQATSGGAFQWFALLSGGAPRRFNLARGAHRVDIARGLAGAALDRVLLTNDPNFTPFDAFIEAEDGSLGSPMVFVPKPPLSITSNVYGTGSIRVQTSTGNDGSGSWFFDAPLRSDYKVWARTATQVPDAEGFAAMLDPFNDNDDWRFQVGATTTGWVWSAIHGGAKGPMHVMLDKGSHLLVLRRSTPGASIDRLFVTNDPGFVPADVPLVVNPLPPITRARAL